MIRKIENYFIWLAAVLLFITAVANLSSTVNNEQFLDQSDPFLILSSRHVLILIGSIELVLSAFLLIGQNRSLQLGLTAWFATNLLVYRIGLESQAAPNYSDCLGNFNDWLPIPPRTLHAIMVGILGFWLIGGYGCLILNWLTNRKPAKTKSFIVGELKST